MGRIEDQVLTTRSKYLKLLEWYATSVNLLNSDHTRALNDLNNAFNERMAEIKEAILPKKHVNANNKPKGKRSL